MCVFRCKERKSKPCENLRVNSLSQIVENHSQTPLKKIRVKAHQEYSFQFEVSLNL